jgi:O-acetyl-ADP-ribose deacetylase (regulator of RNase III)
MIDLVRGDILDSTCDVIVNPVNCLGVMGAGLALQFRHRFPANYTAYVQACNRKELGFGRNFVFERDEPGRYIVNVPTKRHWAEASTLLNVRKGLLALKNFCDEQQVASLALPLLGAGLGRLPEAEVEVEIRDVFAGVSYAVYIYAGFN